MGGVGGVVGGFGVLVVVCFGRQYCEKVELCGEVLYLFFFFCKGGLVCLGERSGEREGVFVFLCFVVGRVGMVEKLQSHFRTRPRRWRRRGGTLRFGGTVLLDLLHPRGWFAVVCAFLSSAILAFIISGVVFVQRMSFQMEDGTESSISPPSIPPAATTVISEVEAGVEASGSHGRDLRQEGVTNNSVGYHHRSTTVVESSGKISTPQSHVAVHLKRELYRGHCPKNLDSAKYLFSTGFRSQVFGAIKAVNNFIRVANGSERVLVGPFVYHDASFKLSCVLDPDVEARDYIGNYFNLRYGDIYPSFCSLSAGVDANVVCPHPNDRINVCIGIKCSGQARIMDLPDDEGTIDVYDDLLDTLQKNERIQRAKCVTVHSYQRGVQDPLLKRHEYAKL